MIGLIRRATIERADLATLEQVLEHLAQFGQPRVGIYSARGWHCSIEMSTNAKGAKFEICSDYAMASPLLAAKQCAERVRDALGALR